MSGNLKILFLDKYTQKQTADRKVQINELLHRNVPSYTCN